MLNRGNLVDVVGVSGSRYKIKIANAYTGYIDKNKITTPDKLTTKYPHGVCTGNDVAVRKGAGKSYDKISGYPTLNKDNEVDILGSKKIVPVMYGKRFVLPGNILVMYLENISNKIKRKDWNIMDAIDAIKIFMTLVNLMYL